MPTNRKEHLRYRYGRCLNDDACTKGKAKEVQQIAARKDFVCEECGKPLRECPPPQSFGQKYGKMIGIVVGILIIAAIVVGIIVSSSNQKTVDDNTPVVDSIVEELPVETIIDKPAVEEAQKPEPSTQAPAAAAPASTSHAKGSVKLAYGTYTGDLKNGQPHGAGTLTYSTSQLIDSRDTKKRVAEAGEYIVGEWDNGRLVQGRWFKKDGTKEAVIIGKAG